MSKVSCYGCDYFFDEEDLTEIVEPHLPADIKLCSDCMGDM